MISLKSQSDAISQSFNSQRENFYSIRCTEANTAAEHTKHTDRTVAHEHNENLKKKKNE